MASLILTVDEIRRLRAGDQTQVRRPVGSFRNPEPFKIGEPIAVRERFGFVEREPNTDKRPRSLKRRAQGVRGPTPGTVLAEFWRPVYAADEADLGRGFPWFPARMMPVGISRLSLSVLGLDRHDLHDMTEVDARNEGASHCRCKADPALADDPFVCDYAHAWDRDFGRESPFAWEHNPEVWAITVAPVFARSP